MTKITVLDQFRKALTSRSIKIAGTVLTPLFMGACAGMPDRVVDSCMKRGGGINLMGLIAFQGADEYKKECDEGRDVALIASARSAEGGADYMGSLIAASIAAQKNPDAQKHYQTQLKLRGLTHEQVVAAAEKLNREAISGVLICNTGDNGKERCSYQTPKTNNVLPFPKLEGTLLPSKTAGEPAPPPAPPANSKAEAALARDSAISTQGRAP